MAYTIGLDFGTNSVRALVVDCTNGREPGTHVFDYPSGRQGILLDPNDPLLARQSPADYLLGLEASIKGALEEAEKNDPEFDPSKVIGIGVAATGSSPLPVDAASRPLALDPKWADHPAAQCWLWKDHTSHREASRITSTAAEQRPQYLAKCGNTYSSEWFWAKVWHALNTAPEVFEAATSWLELADYIPSVLSGVSKPSEVVRNVCSAGHKAMYGEQWGGLPDEDFLKLLDPKLAALRGRLYDKAHPTGTPAGALSGEWAGKLGLPGGITIAVGELDVHYGSIGSGIAEGIVVKALGTSTCDCAVIAADKEVADIPGISGIVNGSILPGYIGIEAGQSAVGDIFKWFVEGVMEGDGSRHAKFTEEATRQAPGQSGLMALDWNNGNRNILADPMLTGLLVGQTLHTTGAEIYRALIEATAFGARTIIERLTEYGVPVEKVVCCGGIAEKNPFLMQLYADITGCTMQVAGSGQAAALGAAIGAAVTAGAGNGGYHDFPTAQAQMTSWKETVYRPQAENRKIYDRLYAIYRQLHDAFGGVNRQTDVSRVMKELIEIREAQRPRG